MIAIDPDQVIEDIYDLVIKLHGIALHELIAGGDVRFRPEAVELAREIAEKARDLADWLDRGGFRPLLPVAGR